MEAFKAERAAKAKARAEGSVPMVRRRKPGREDVDITPSVRRDHGRFVVHLADAGAARAGAAARAPRAAAACWSSRSLSCSPARLARAASCAMQALYPVVEKRIRDCCAEVGLDVLVVDRQPHSGRRRQPRILYSRKEGCMNAAKTEPSVSR